MISIAAEDLERLDFDTGEIDGPGRRSAHTLAIQLERSARSGVMSFGRTIKRWPSW